MKGRFRLQELPELLDVQTGVANDASHSECIDGIVARNCKDSRAIGHNNVCTLPKNAKPRFLQRGYGSQMVNSR